jgi:hypothetical protein
MKVLIAIIWAAAVIGCHGKRNAEEVYQKQQEEPPVLLYKQNGVCLYRIYDTEKSQTVYFTTPVGETQWTVPGDDDRPAKQFNVGGKK